MAWVERLTWGSHQVHLFAVSNPVRSGGSLVVSLLALVTVNGGALGVVWLVGRALPKVAVGLAADASPVRGGFEPGPGEVGPADWVAYVAEQVASLVLFDLPRVLHLRLAPIRPSGGLAVAAMLAFRVLFALGLAEAAVELWRRWRA